MLRRIGVLASLAAVAAMFAGISSAQAAPGDTFGVCVFTGLAGNLTPIEDISTDVLTPGASNPLPPPLDYEQGSYNYGLQNPAGATCAGRFKGTPVIPSVGNAGITSIGNYDNILCGTGFAHDGDGNQSTLTDNTSGVSITGAGYQIPFVAGNGPLIIGPTGAPNLAALAGAPPHAAGDSHANINSVDKSSPTPDPTTQYVGGGAVHITAGSNADGPPVPTPGNPRDNCGMSPGDGDSAPGFTNEFEVAGFLIAAGVPVL